MAFTYCFCRPFPPNLSIIERLWEFTKKKILYAKYYDKPNLFHQAVQEFFEEINENFKLELHSLLTLKFQFFNNQNSLIYPLSSIDSEIEVQYMNAWQISA